MTFGLLYAFTENFVLPLCHDEVVHGKGSLLGKMPGDRWQKFANLRAYFGFMWTHPGKKLLFMGGEFAQEREWNHDQSLDWHLLDDPQHRGVQALVRDLNRLYRELPALHVLDAEPAGFEWIDADDADHSVYAFLRNGGPDDAPVARRLQLHAGRAPGLPRRRAARRRAGSSASTPTPRSTAARMSATAGVVRAEPAPWQGRPASLSLTLPPLATIDPPARRIGATSPPWRNCASSPACPIRSGRPGTAAASTSRSSPPMRRRSSSACSTRRASARPTASRCPNTRTRSGTAICRTSGRASSTATACTAPTTRRTATASTRTSC